MTEYLDSIAVGSGRLRISCVIPTFNRCNQLLAAIQSVAGQTQPAEEIIVIDDGSTDRTLIALQQLQESQPYLPLRVLRQQNRGPAAARNAGIRLAHSEYIAFLDDDDIWLPNKLAKQREYLAADQSLDLLGCATDTFSFFGPPRLIPISTWQLLLSNWLLTPGVVVRRSAILACGGFPENMRCCEDYAAWLSLIDHHKCAVLNEVLVVCGHGKPSFGASGLSRDLRALYAGEREALYRWQESRQAGYLLCMLTGLLPIARHWRRRLAVMARNS